jgi:N-acetyl-D-muramate 6-phosphate phosphatase
MPLNDSRIRLICFDVDGTLSDTDDLMVVRLTRLLRPLSPLFRRHGIDRFARRMVMAAEAPANFLIGLPDLFGLDRPVFTLADWLARHSRRKPGRLLMVPGVKEMLADLNQRYPLAVVSARDERTTYSFLEQFDLLRFFRCIACSQTCKHTKPFPDPILWAAAEVKVPAADCLMVGDTSVDMRAASAAGSQKVGVLCGFGEREELLRHGADMILATTAELAEVLRAA